MWLHGTTEMEGGKVYSSYKLLRTNIRVIKDGDNFSLLVGNEAIAHDTDRKALMSIANNL